LDVTERYRLVTENLDETVTPDELRSLLETEDHPSAYWGFEPSGMMHLGTGLLCGYKILDLVNAGFNFTIFLADWHAWINNKLGGNIDDIRFCGEYFIQGFSSIGLTPNRVRYIWASELMEQPGYLETTIRIGKSINLSRLYRCLPVMGRAMGLKDMEAAALLYPCMQVADIFQLKLDCACAGIDQRKAHMLARDVAEKMGRKKPICLHTHLLLGLTGAVAGGSAKFDEDAAVSQEIGTKMSKSIPGNCIYIHDSPAEIRNKVVKAYCPPKVTVGNPVLEVAKYIIFSRDGSLPVERPAKYGGSVEFHSYAELERSYMAGGLHPLDLKNSVAEALAKLLEPVRSYFKNKQKMLQRMKKLEATR